LISSPDLRVVDRGASERQDPGRDDQLVEFAVQPAYIVPGQSVFRGPALLGGQIWHMEQALGLFRGLGGIECSFRPKIEHDTPFGWWLGEIAFLRHYRAASSRSRT